MGEIGEAFWTAAWAFVDFLEEILIWLQGAFGELYVFLSEFVKIRFQFRIASQTIMLPIMAVIILVAFAGNFIARIFRRRRRRRRSM